MDYCIDAQVLNAYPPQALQRNLQGLQQLMESYGEVRRPLYSRFYLPEVSHKPL